MNVEIGFDFGNYSTVISFVDEKGNIIEYKPNFSMLGYISTVIALRDRGLEIGTRARYRYNNSEWRVFSGFKFSLENNPLDTYDKKFELSYYVIERFIHEIIGDIEHWLLRSFDYSINSITVLIPEFWFTKRGYIARERIVNIFKGTKYEINNIVSEPTAAAAFFLSEYGISKDSQYLGYLLICDYGGGSLSFYLSYIREENKINVLEGFRESSTHENPYGIAGLAYDKAVIRKVFGDSLYNCNILLSEYENARIDVDIHEMSFFLRNYIEKKDSVSVFHVRGVSITSKVLCEVYNEFIEPFFIEKLFNVKRFLLNYGLSPDRANLLKIIMVGGFSINFLVQNTHDNFFKNAGYKNSLDFKFDDGDKFSAISKGGALIANEDFSISNISPISFGIKAYNADNEVCYCPILFSGTSLDSCEYNVLYADILFILNDVVDFEESAITLYSETPSGRRVEYNLTHNMFKCLPNPSLNNRWKIGVTVDKYMIFRLHIKDIDKNDNHIVTLGNISKGILSPDVRS